MMVRHTIALLLLLVLAGPAWSQATTSHVRSAKSRPNGWVVTGGLATLSAVVVATNRERIPMLVWETDPAHQLSVLEAAALGAGIGTVMGLVLCADWGDCDWGPPRLPRLGPRKPRAQVRVTPTGAIGVTIYR